VLCCIVIGAVHDAGAIEGRLMRSPDIHGDRVVFTYEDDLWSAPAGGGLASRLTSHPGIENHASFSPGGEWIAFTGSYDGGYDVYVIPTVGGEPRRLTYHPAYDRVVGWTPDGEAVLFVSFRTLQQELYRVGMSGGFPEKMPLDQVSYASPSPDGDEIAINRFNSDRMNWKGYKGGQQQDIWIADTGGKRFERITDWEGYDNQPMWHGGQIYFNSDREDGRMNLYVYDIGSDATRRCTHHTEWDVEFPALGEDRIVYGCEGYLWVYDILADRSERLVIEIPSDRWQMRDMYISPGGYLQEIGLGRDGKKCVVQARGDIYLLDTEKERAVNITRTMGSRELRPALSPKGDTIAFFSDRSGEYELYTAPTRPDGEWSPITADTRSYYYDIHWSPDGSKLLYGDKDYAIYVSDVGTRETKRIDRCLYQKDNEIFWEWSDYGWSPDGRWIVYSTVDENLNSSIFLYSLETGEIHRITDDRYDDYSPCFDPEGASIYFLSLRNFTPELDWFMDNNINTDMSKVMVVQLKAGERPPFHEIEEDPEQPGEQAEADTTAVPAGDSIRIDLEGIADRVFTVPIEPGTYRMLTAYKGHIAYLSRDGYGFPGLQEFLNPKSVTHYDLHIFDTEKKEDRTVIEGIGYYSLSGDGSMAAYISGLLSGVVKTDGQSSAGDGALKWGGLQHKVDIFQEYPQIYRDVWRQVRDFFYDPRVHGKDWDGIYAKYQILIPSVATRADMNYIIGHMLGELTASHEYIIGRGGPPRTFYSRTNVGLLGADLAPERESGRYRFSHIIEDSRWNEESRGPLRDPHIDIREGDYLLAIDGREVSSEENYLKYLENRSGDEITITVGRTPALEEGTTYRIKPIGSEYFLRYHEWVERNYRTVRKETNGRVGYMHLADMDEIGIRQFEQAFRAERYRDGLIIDVRQNGGGFVSWFMIDKLERALTFMTVTRDFEPMRYPHGVHAGPIVVLCDENTGSDGEVFTQHFKDLGLGMVVGKPTWGGLIGIINMIPLTDGGMVTQSNVGFANLAGEWIVENRGAIPDIIVDNDPAEVVRGRDQQLKEAIRLIGDLLRDDPPPKLTPPAFPEK
ncbi:MAG TPA: S41 family peptidase, partial [Patescibacteria group bacterium]|nr:S41 family peptidase [Patescibacteria group bacterium]